MRIGELARRAGLSRDTLRYYERRGLLDGDGPARRPNGYRDYSERTLERLRRIRELKGHGFTLSEIRRVLETRASAVRCEGVPEALHAKLRAVDARIAELRRHRARLRASLASCGGAECAHPL